MWFEMGGTEAVHCSAPGGPGANSYPALIPHRRRPAAPPSGCRTARLMLCALGLAALPRGGDSGQAGRDPALVLAPGISLDRQAMEYGESRSFRLSQLAPSAMYEVKVSYPASVSFPHTPRGLLWRLLFSSVYQVYPCVCAHLPCRVRSFSIRHP